MFRLPPPIDPAEEQKRLRLEVRNNLIAFAVICAVLRLGRYYKRNYTIYPTITTTTITL